MTYAQSAHMIAAMLVPPPEHLRATYARLRGQLNAFPCAPRVAVLDIARESFRLAEYFEARHGELPMLADVCDRAARGQSTERALERLDAYWRRTADWLRSLGPNASPVLAEMHPNPNWPDDPPEATS